LAGDDARTPPHAMLSAFMIDLALVAGTVILHAATPDALSVNVSS
jgi:hypothetical protein